MMAKISLKDSPGLLSPAPMACNRIKEYGSKQDTNKSKKKYITSFTHRLLPASSFKKGIEEELKHKSFVFDNVQKKKTVCPRKKRTTLTAKEKRRLLLSETGGQNQCYESLSALWGGYINDLIDFTKVKEMKPEEIERKILKADLHGSRLHVTKSKCPSLVGCKGIVIQETKSTFKLSTPDRKVKVVPKRNTDFTLYVRGWACTIHGNNFLFRPADRASRNFKNQSSFDL